MPLPKRPLLLATMLSALLVGCGDPHGQTGSDRGEKPPEDRPASR